MTGAPTWDLEVLCPGGPGGAPFALRRDSAAKDVAAVAARVDALRAVTEDPAGWESLIEQLEALRARLDELGSFASCAASTDTGSLAARAAEAAIDEVQLALRQASVGCNARLDEMSEAEFEAFVARAAMTAHAPALRHARGGRRLRLPPDLEGLRVSMDREAIQGWGRLYDLVSGGLVAELDLDGQKKRVGIAEAAALRADASAEVRRAAHEGSQRAWSSIADVCAHTLTQITGTRQQRCDRLGVDELASSLYENRLSASSLSAMWAATRTARPALVRYLAHKAKLLSKPALDWWDLDAPLPSEAAEIDWARASDTVADAFGAFHPELGAFAREAYARRWIDAQAGGGRRQGGFCASFTSVDQSRIFMTFAGSLDNAGTLAHELGHAWHNRVLSGEHPARSNITSALAETASVFGEAVFRGQVLASATDPAFRAFMLDQQLQAGLAFLMDVPHRFALERRFYALRRDGPLEPDRLSREVVDLQREHWGDALASYNPTFWCSKLHFYIPEFGFYNWPYTFGYLFSSAVYRLAVDEGPSFMPTLRDLLVRTGWQDSEGLARDVLGADLGDEAFWNRAVASIPDMVDSFVEATS